MTNNEALKPCPFCGGEAGTQFDDEPYYYCYHGSKGLYYAGCKKCGASSRNYNTEEEAIAAWNKRKKENI
jgi:Lar family restriction alleviation protein